METSAPKDNTGIEPTALAVLHELKRLPRQRKRLSENSQRLFAVSLSLVAHRIRSAYLVDAIAPGDAIGFFSQLIDALRRANTTKKLFSRVFHVYEPSAEQSFFVHADLLSGRIQNEVIGQSGTVHLCSVPPAFIYIGSPITMMAHPPSDLVRILGILFSLTSGLDPLPLSFTLPTDVSFQTAVPMAAFLLDYPIAYVPTDDIHALAGSTLDFYECILISQRNGTKLSDGKGNGHTIIKFSCPAQRIEIECECCTPAKIMLHLKKMFVERLRLLGDVDLECIVVHTTEMVDNVVF